MRIMGPAEQLRDRLKKEDPQALTLIDSCELKPWTEQKNILAALLE